MAGRNDVDALLEGLLKGLREGLAELEAERTAAQSRVESAEDKQARQEKRRQRHAQLRRMETIGFSQSTPRAHREVLPTPRLKGAGVVGTGQDYLRVELALGMSQALHGATGLDIEAMREAIEQGRAEAHEALHDWLRGRAMQEELFGLGLAFDLKTASSYLRDTSQPLPGEEDDEPICEGCCDGCEDCDGCPEDCPECAPDGDGEEDDDAPDSDDAEDAKREADEESRSDVPDEDREAFEHAMGKPD